MAKGMSFKVLMQLQTKEFQKGIKSIQRQLNGFKNFMKSAFALGSITMFGKQVVQVGKDFENAMAKVQAVSNATQDEFRKMTAEAQRLGSTTRYTATEAAEALENLTRNGMSASNATKALSSVLQLAQANSIGLADAANIVTNTLNMFNLSVSQTNRVNDVLSSTASHAATDIQSLYEAMVNAAPAANVLGFSIEEVSSAIGALAQRGVKGAEAGTKLRIAFQKMADPKVIGKMHEQGIEIDENTIKTEGLRKTIEKIAKADLSLGQLGKIFDAKSAMAVQMLVASLGDLDYMLDVTANSAGETERMFNQSVGSVQKELDTLKSMYEGLLISISQKTSGVVKSTVKLLQNLIANFKTVGGTIANLASVVVPLLTKRIVTLGTTIRTVFSQAATSAAALQAAMGGWITIIATLVTWVSTALVGAWNRANAEMREANNQMAKAESESRKLQRAVDELKDEIGDGTNENTVNGVVAKAIRLFPEFADAIRDAARVAAQTGDWEHLRSVLQDIVDIQNAIATRDAKKAVQRAAGRKVGTELYNSGSWWDIPGKILSNSQEPGKHVTEGDRLRHEFSSAVRKQLKDAGFNTDEIKNIFNQVGELITSTSDVAKKSSEIQKLLGDYGVKIDEGPIKSIVGDVIAESLDKKNPSVIGIEAGQQAEHADSTAANKQARFFINQFNDIEKLEKDNLDKRLINQRDFNNKLGKEASELFKKVAELDKVDDAIKEEVSNIVKKYPLPRTTTGGSGGGSGSGGKVVKTDTDKISDAIKDYNDGVAKLNNRLAAGTITAEDYEKELDSLEDKTWEAITAFSNFNDILDKLGKKDLGNDLDNKYKDNRVKEAASQLAKQLGALGKFGVPSKPSRDASRDYAKTTSQIAEEKVKVEFEYKEALEKLVKDFQEAIDDGDFNLVKEEALVMLEELKKKALEAAESADTLQAKLDLSEAIKKLDSEIKDLNQTAFDTFQSVAQAMDRVIQGLMSIAEVFDEDLRNSPLFQGIEAFTSVLNGGIQMMQATMAILELVNQMKNKSAKESVKNAAMEVAANEMATASATKKAAAEATAAAAGGAESVASIPYVGPILAVAAIASITAALLAAFSKFESGGIVGGNSFSGDKKFARLNSGEAVLTRSQQASLWKAIETGNYGGGGSVEFKIRGADLVGTLNNYNRLRQ